MTCIFYKKREIKKLKDDLRKSDDRNKTLHKDIEGLNKKISSVESEDYFNSRPFESKAAAIISNQSEDIDSYESLLEKYNSFIEQNKNTKLKRPNNWGGIEIFINQIEFWQGRKNRLHNRVLCNFHKDTWEYKLLSP